MPRIGLFRLEFTRRKDKIYQEIAKGKVAIHAPAIQFVHRNLIQFFQAISPRCGTANRHLTSYFVSQPFLAPIDKLANKSDCKPYEEKLLTLLASTVLRLSLHHSNYGRI